MHARKQALPRLAKAERTLVDAKEVAQGVAESWAEAEHYLLACREAAGKAEETLRHLAHYPGGNRCRA
eukprot:453351-Prorocentrum_lima.AAC.1